MNDEVILNLTYKAETNKERSDRNTATIAKMSARKGWTQLSKDQHLLLVVAIDDFLQRFFFFWQISGLYSHFHT